MTGSHGSDWGSRADSIDVQENSSADGFDTVIGGDAVDVIFLDPVDLLI